MNKLYIAAFAMLTLMSCSDNLFGSGSSSGNCGNDIQCLRIEAQNAFRNGHYENAHNIYAKIVTIDSNASIGYFGMAKSGLWMKGINPFDVFRFISIDDDQIPFIGETVIIQNRYLQGMRAAAIPLAILQRRDSLTALWEHHLENPSPLARLDTFRLVFCGNSPTGTCRDTTKNKTPFPLSDREYKYNTYYGGLLISTMAKSVLEFFDNNHDGCLTRRGAPGVDNPGDITEDVKWKAWGCAKGTNGKYSHDFSVNIAKDADGNFIIDTEQALEELYEILEPFYLEQLNNPDAPLPDEIVNLNNKIDEFAGSLDEVANILGSVGMDFGDLIDDECDAKEDDDECESGLDSIPSDPNAWQNEINKYKDFASFYRMGTRVDEDGDGCVDEEMLNKQDNDGDGIKGENSRLASLDSQNPFLWGKAGTNHSMRGNPEGAADINNWINYPTVLPTLAPHYICNTPNCYIQTELWGDEEGFVTVIGFTREPGYWTTSDLDLKLKVAQDTVCPPKYDLKFRQDSIGGCWKNYDTDKFVTYWLKRKLAREPGRVHSSCLLCEGIACLKD